MDEPTVVGQSDPSEPTSDALNIETMPTFLAVNYQQLLTATTPAEQITLALRIYELGLRALAINLLNQYLVRDQDTFTEPPLNDFILEKFATLTLDACQELLFRLLRAYEGKHDKLFVPELYDFYWETTTSPHRPRLDRAVPFSRLTQIDALWKQVTLAAPDARVPAPVLDLPALALETKTQLQRVLADLGFITRYDLIRLLVVEEDSYAYELHRGPTPTQQRAPLPDSYMSIGWNTGQFYLRSPAGELLALHPLVIFAQTQDASGQIIAGDTAIFQDSFDDYTQLRYMLATAGKTLTGSQHFADFVALVYDTIREIKMLRLKVDHLTWSQLSEICQAITDVRMATVARKYDRAVYLQRLRVRQEFEHFLDSDKRCFILIGKSGVGKSNFLLSLRDEFAQTRRSCCLLLYDGGQLRGSVRATIAEDFARRWKQVKKDGKGKIISIEQRPIWEELVENEQLVGHQVVLGVDAVNESQHASELLRELDALAQEPWPWLKIVLSCRPETWHAIKRGLRLSDDLYYRKQDSEHLEVELEQLEVERAAPAPSAEQQSFSDELDNFTRQELEQAYEKYQARYKLQTRYGELPGAIKELLREPLHLFLVASSYRGKVIPASLKVGELVRRYIDALIDNDLLRRADLDFLEEHLVPLMLRPGAYTNELSASTLKQANELLYNQIYNETTLPDGQKLNQSYLHLCDVDILVREGSGREQKIKFKYERFYEYFVGQHLFLLGQQQPDRPTFYAELIQAIAKTPYLWGAVKQALIRQAREKDYQVVVGLCFTDDHRTKELLTTALVELGRDERERVEAILEQLLARPVPPGRWRRVRQLLRQNISCASAELTAGKIAVEVASTLGLPWVLHAGGMHADPALRIATVRESYRLWTRDREAGFAVLDYLARQATPGLIPNIRAFETVFGLTMIVFFQYYQEPAVRGRLQEIWRGIVGQVLRIQEGGSRIGTAIRGFVRERVLSFGYAAVFNILRQHPQLPVDFDAFESFFKLGPERKQLYIRMISYMDPAGSYDPAAMEEDFLAALETKSLLFELALTMPLVVHSAADPLAYLPLFERLLAAAKVCPHPIAYMGAVFNSLPGIIDLNPVTEEIRQLFLKEFLAYARLWPENKREAGYHEGHILHQHRHTDLRNGPFLTEAFALAIKHKNLKFFQFMLKSELSLLAIDKNRPQLALDILGMFFHADIPTDGKIPGLQALIQTYLARLRLYYPEQVEDFLEDHRAPEEYRLAVRTADPQETIADLIGTRIWWFVHDQVLLGSPELRARLIGVFTKAVEVKNLHGWVSLFMREIINTVYGGEALR